MRTKHARQIREGIDRARRQALRNRPWVFYALVSDVTPTLSDRAYDRTSRRFAGVPDPTPPPAASGRIPPRRVPASPTIGRVSDESV